MEHKKLIEKHLGINTPYWIKEKVDNAINEALRKPTIIGSVCDGCGSKFDAMDISVGVCYCCQKEIKQTDL